MQFSGPVPHRLHARILRDGFVGKERRFVRYLVADRGNWPQGSAYAFVLLIACLIFVLAIMRLFKVSLGEIAK